jgi:hypothetical protein
MQTLCRLKPGQQSEIADESHFNFRCFTEISMGNSQLKNLNIIPALIRQASADYVLDIDWDGK